MTDPPPTRPSLLMRLRDARDGDAWRQFVELYAPLVYSYARRHRLQDADAADLTQEVLRAVSGAVGRLEYDPERGSFRGWVFTLAHRKLCDFLTRRRRQEQGSGDTATQGVLNDLPAPEEEQWERDYERRLFVWAAERARGEFREATWQAFWQTAVEGRPAADISRTLGISVGAVYIAKSRVQARLKALVQEARAE
jgi:RNA polymerase sigma-70 factor (ECF subfamily)